MFFTSYVLYDPVTSVMSLDIRYYALLIIGDKWLVKRIGLSVIPRNTYLDRSNNDNGRDP